MQLVPTVLKNTAFFLGCSKRIAQNMVLLCNVPKELPKTWYYFVMYDGRASEKQTGHVVDDLGTIMINLPTKFIHVHCTHIPQNY